MPSLDPHWLETLFATLPPDPPVRPAGRQPLHTVYGGANLFSPQTVRKLGAIALRALQEYAPTPAAVSAVLEIPPALAEAVYQRLESKLRTEAIEDYRVDFEDGYGYRSDEEEDGHAVAVARAFREAGREGMLPPFTGFRIRSLRVPTRHRAVRTLDLLLTELAPNLPPQFCITLPKVSSAEEVRVLVALLAELESRLGLPAAHLRLELMIETPAAVNLLADLAAAAEGRCLAVHFGAWDYTAAYDITARDQDLLHPVSTDARIAMQRALADTGIWLVDGASNVLPVPPHKGAELTPAQRDENRAVVHRAWRYHAARVRNALRNGFYQGWDLHPAQIPARFGVVYSFFLEQLPQAAARLRNFIEAAARSTMVGDVFDDAASGQGLLNFFVRAARCGALSEAEILEHTGLTLTELRSGSFEQILEGRKGAASVR
jgi:citrate lyase beta subunit